jgi:taurine dioxygenase
MTVDSELDAMLRPAAWQTRPIAGRVGLEIQGADLARELGPEAVEGLHQLVARYGVVIFTDQHVREYDHLRLARQLGVPKLPPDYLPSLAASGFPEISVISTDNGFAAMTDQWHTDVTWLPNPPRYSILHMQDAPAAGGDTMWASQIVACERLSGSMRRFLVSLTAAHGLPIGGGPSATHPVICRHPLTGGHGLFVNSTFTRRICELTSDESNAVLQFLFVHSTAPEGVCRWRWSNGDIAIWDNHFVQHYAINDYGPAKRAIHRIEIVGEPPQPADVTLVD